ncbi:MAG: DUF3592 domain-containing protein [Methylacidiphilales bacterium]|nr:DUF3592 domain-containing protein [Candidatus Methylacidiphilales bacterium]
MLLLIVLVLFPFVTWQAYKKICLAKASAAWPTAPGVVTATERTKIAWRTQPRISFRYEVGGKTYTSSKLSFADVVPASETEPILARYRPSQPVTVHYQPENPALAVLEPGPNRHLSAAFRYYFISFGILIAVNVLYLGVTFWTSSDSAADQQAPTYDDVAKADPQLGDRLLRADAEKGNAQDQVYVATWYLTGTEGYPKDPAEAAKWLRKAADQGNADAENMLGQLYAGGKGVDKDLVQAVAWLQKAADQGEPHACASLGYAYEKGLGGLTQDTPTAIAWYRKAGKEPHAQAALARLGATP